MTRPKIERYRFRNFFWYQNFPRPVPGLFRYQIFSKPKKVLESVSKKFGTEEGPEPVSENVRTEKSLGISIVQILGLVTHCSKVVNICSIICICNVVSSCYVVSTCYVLRRKYLQHHKYLQRCK